MTADDSLKEQTPYTPTDEQVRKAAEAAHKFDAEVSEMFGKPFDPDLSSLPQWAYNTHLDKARAALTAAGVAPQAPSVDREKILTIINSNSEPHYSSEYGHGLFTTCQDEIADEIVAALTAPPVFDVDKIAGVVHASHRKWCLLDKQCPEARVIALAMVAHLRGESND